MNIDKYFKQIVIQKWVHAFLGFSFAFALTERKDNKIWPILGCIFAYIYLRRSETQTSEYEKQLVLKKEEKD